MRLLSASSARSRTTRLPLQISVVLVLWLSGSGEYLLGEMAEPSRNKTSEFPQESWGLGDCPSLSLPNLSAISCETSTTGAKGPSWLMPELDSSRLVQFAFLPANDLSDPDQGSVPKERRGSPPLGSFGDQLLENFKGLFSQNSLKPLLIGSAATGLAAIADEEIQEFFGETRRFKELGDIGQVIGGPLTVGALSGGILLWGYNTENDQLRSMGFSLTQGFIVNGAVTLGLKSLIPRTRPDGEDDDSFPSGHTSGCFTTAAIVAHHYSKAAIPAYTIAGLIGFSRVEKNRHYLSDVVAGATLGIIVGRTVCRQTDTFRKGPVTWMPVVLPEGGVAVALYLRPEGW